MERVDTGLCSWSFAMLCVLTLGSYYALNAGGSVPPTGGSSSEGQREPAAGSTSAIGGHKAIDWNYDEKNESFIKNVTKAFEDKKITEGVKEELILAFKEMSERYTGAIKATKDYYGSVVELQAVIVQKKQLLKIDKSNTEIVWNKNKDAVLMVSVIPDHIVQKLYASKKAEENINRWFKTPRLITTSSGEKKNLPTMCWVTAVPQLKKFMQGKVADKGWFKKPGREFVDKVKLVDRTRAFLGLPPSILDHDAKFVEMWVRPEDLFRPCRCPYVNLATCYSYDDCPPSTSDNDNTIRENHKFFLDKQAKGAFETTGFPWTCEGFAYDWLRDPSEEIGATEFVIRWGSNVVLRDANGFSAQDYINQPTPASGTAEVKMPPLAKDAEAERKEPEAQKTVGGIIVVGTESFVPPLGEVVGYSTPTQTTR